MIKGLQKWFKENADTRTGAIILVGFIFCLIWIWLGIAGKVEDVRFDSEEAQLLDTGWQINTNGLIQEVTLPGKIGAEA